MTVRKLGQHLAKELLAILGIPADGVRNVRVNITANLNECAVARVEIDRLLSIEESQKLIELANRMEPIVTEKGVAPELAEPGVEDISDVTSDWKKFRKV